MKSRASSSPSPHTQENLGRCCDPLHRPHKCCNVASGTSPGTTCPSGPRQIIRHQVDGILVPNEDVNALALTMDRLMSDPILRQRLGRRSVEVVERFSVQKIAGMWEILLDQVVNAHRGPIF